MKKITQSIFAALLILAILVGCEVDEFQNGLTIASVAQSFSVTGDLNRSAYKRANTDGSLNAALGSASLTGFLPLDQAYINAGYINTESTSEGDANALKEILLYHISEGAKKASEINAGELSTLATGKSFSVNRTDNVVVSGLGNQGVTGKLVGTDAKLNNGYIHTIDVLLLPNPRKLTDITIQNGYFDILEAAMIRADLVTTLSGTGPFTIFAPGDAAFIEYLGIPTKDAEGKDRPHTTVQNEALAAIQTKTPEELADLLTYHVVSGNLEAGDFVTGSLATLNGKSVEIVVDKGVWKNVTGIGNVADEEAEPMQTNVLGINGIIHIVNRVLIPE